MNQMPFTADLGDNPHSVAGGGVAGSRQASPPRRWAVLGCHRADNRAPAQAGDVMRYGVCVVLGMLSFAGPAGAQHMSQHWARCLNEQEAFTADQSIEGCTAVIQAARGVPAKLAIAFNSRGNSHAAKDQPDRAIEDYDQALRLKPNEAVLLSDRCYAKASAGALAAALADCNEALGG